jgi:hypothetical protein
LVDLTLAMELALFACWLMAPTGWCPQRHNEGGPDEPDRW